MSAPANSTQHLPLPRENTVLHGQDAAEQSLLADLASGRMAHAWLFTGPAGVGKATLAWRLARAVLAGGRTLDVPAHHPTARLIAAGTHPDILCISPPIDEKTGREAKEIPVELVRKIEPFLRLTSAHGGWRVVIIEQAERLNRNSQNALLKILEEPPRGALIILTAPTAGQLLPTTRSRCRSLRLQPLSPSKIDQLLQRYQPHLTEPQRSELTRLAQGSIGRALRLAQHNGVALYQQLENMLAHLPAIHWAEAHVFADALAGKDGEAQRGLVAEILPEIIAKQLKPAMQSAAWMAMYDACQQALSELEKSHLDAKSAWLALLDRLQQLAKAA